MAYGDFYDVRAYNWQLRELPGHRIMVRYDSLPIDQSNKGRYNTSAVVKVETNSANDVRFTTQSGSQYVFKVEKCAHPMQLIALTLKFDVEF